MTFARHVPAVACLAALAVLALPACLSGQMHKVAKPDEVTRAVGVYEYVGDLTKPRAARLIPISLFIGGHFEDAAVYMARPIPFVLDTGFRYELMQAGVRKQFLDLVAARNFAGSSAAASTPFDDGWFGYGQVKPLPTPKSAKLRPNCGNAHVVQEADTSRPHFGTKSGDEKSASAKAPAKDDPCYASDDDDRPEKISLQDAAKEKDKDKNAPDPERPTLHRSPETTANNTGANGKTDKKAPKQPQATITANGSPADDPDRPTIKHREVADNDPNALPPDPLDLPSRDAAAKASNQPASAPSSTASAAVGSNNTVTENASITEGNTMGGGPVLRRGKLTQPKDDDAPTAAVSVPAKPTAVAAKPPVKTPGKPSFANAPASSTPVIPPSVLAPPLDSIVAVSDAKDRPAHDYSYHFASTTERAAALQSLEAMAQAVLEKPSLASDALEVNSTYATQTATTPTKSTTTRATATKTTTAVHPAPVAHPGPAARARAAAASANTAPQLADEQMFAFQLYYSAPISYTFTARTPATATTPERYVVVVATTDGEGKIEPAFRSVTDAAHLDRIPRYRLIDAVDADATNRAELLMELRAQHTRQFALYRLLGNKPDQVFVSGSTLL
jgi:hypothetical protein